MLKNHKLINDLKELDNQEWMPRKTRIQKGIFLLFFSICLMTLAINAVIKFKFYDLSVFSSTEKLPDEVYGVILFTGISFMFGFFGIRCLLNK